MAGKLSDIEALAPDGECVCNYPGGCICPDAERALRAIQRIECATDAGHYLWRIPPALQSSGAANG